MLHSSISVNKLRSNWSAIDVQWGVSFINNRLLAGNFKSLLKDDFLG